MSPCRVFCASMADVLEERDDAIGAELDQARARLWSLILDTPHLDWLPPDEATGRRAAAHSTGGAVTSNLLVRDDRGNPSARLAPRQAHRRAGGAALRERRAAPRAAGPHALVARDRPDAGRLVGDLRRRERPGVSANGARLGPRDARSLPADGRAVLTSNPVAPRRSPGAGSWTDGPGRNGRSTARRGATLNP